MSRPLAAGEPAINLTARERLEILGAILLALFLFALDQTVVGTALPRIVTDLHGNQLYTWAVSVYLLTSTISGPIYGKLSDLFGRRPIIIFAVSLFLVASVLAGLSQEMWQLILFRGLQGLGGGAVFPVALAVVADLYTPAERGKYLGFFGAVFGLSSLLGPGIGGFITDTWSWHWIFFVNVPIGLVSLFILWRLLPTIRRPEAARNIDFVGAAVFAFAIGSFLIGLTNKGGFHLVNGAPVANEWGDPSVGGLILLGLIAGVVFLWIESRVPEPIVPLSLFRIRSFTISVAAMFLAGVMTVVALARRTDGRLLTPLAIGAAAVAPVAALNLVFSEKGLEPFVFSAWIALPLWCGGALYVTRRNRAERELRAGIIGYLVVGTLVWMIPNPLGGNATRLGALFGGPLLVAALRSGRVRLATPAVVLVLVGSVWWQVSGAVRDVARSFGDPSTRAAYYEPLARWLRAHGGSGVRIEVPFTSGHWETAYLAPEFELARGWLRQLDRSRNGLFYRDRLPSARYRAWLVRSGIRYVALADTATDYSARAEQRLIESRPRYLHLKARLDHWQVYRVVGARPLAQSLGTGRARLRELRPSSFTLAVTKPGRFLVRIRGTPYWSVRTGNACVGQGGPWTVVRADRAGTVRASIRFSFSAAARAATGSRHTC